MPEMSRQLVILRRLTAHLAGMTEAGGYGFDMAGRVHRGRTSYGKETALPALSILESPSGGEGPAADDEGLVRSLRWQLFIQGWVVDDAENPTDPAYALKAQVEKRLAEIVAERNGRPAYPSLYRLGGIISEISWGTGVVRPPQENVSDRAFFWLPVTITFAGNAASPLLTVADTDNP